jgi:hypothetical protein
MDRETLTRNSFGRENRHGGVVSTAQVLLLSNPLFVGNESDPFLASPARDTLSRFVVDNQLSHDLE